MDTKEEAIKFVQEIICTFDKDILEAFYKEIRYNNNEITKLQQKIAKHKAKIEEMLKKESKFKWLAKQAKHQEEVK